MRQIITALVVGFLAFAAGAQDFDKASAEAMAVWKMPALAVAVVQDDKVVFLKAYGVKELGLKLPVTVDTAFQIGSTTKAFTTTAMAMLVDEKKLSWDDPVSRHLPWFHLSDPCAEATLRDIVSHRTGVARHDELWDDSGLSRDDILHRVAGLKLSKPFRTAYQYNNIMFMAAGEVVAAASKMSWDDFVRTRIFAPLGMTHTRTKFAEWDPSDHASGHTYSAGHTNPLAAHEYTSLGPAGVIMSSASDMAQWLRFQLAGGVIDGKRLVSAEALNETRAPLTPIAIDDDARAINPYTHVQSYAMGWNVSDYRGELLVAHGGALNGFRTQIAMLPERHAGVVVMTNVGRGYAVFALRNTLLDEILHAAPARNWNDAYAVMETQAEEKAAKIKADRLAKRVPNTHPSRELAAYAGTYHDAAYGDATIKFVDGTLFFEWQRLSIDLSHYHYDTFYAFDENHDINDFVQFALDGDGNVKTMTFFGQEFVRP